MGENIMWFHAALATAVMTLAVTPACAAKITVSQYGRLVATLPWAVALQKNMFKEAGLDIDGITAGAGGGTSLRNMLAGELPYAELATSAAIAGSLAGVELKALASSSNHIGELSWAAKPDAGINSINDLVGKKVAYTNPRSITEMVIRTALKQEGLAGKVDILPLGGLGPALTALRRRGVEAAARARRRSDIWPVTSNTRGSTAAPAEAGSRRAGNRIGRRSSRAASTSAISAGPRTARGAGSSANTSLASTRAWRWAAPTMPSAPMAN